MTTADFRELQTEIVAVANGNDGEQIEKNDQAGGDQSFPAQGAAVDPEEDDDGQQNDGKQSVAERAEEIFQPADFDQKAVKGEVMPLGGQSQDGAKRPTEQPEERGQIKEEGDKCHPRQSAHMSH
jgi:hypothetical protein